MPLGTEVGLGLRDIVLDRDPAPPPIKGHSSHQFSANVHCGQTAGWTKMPLGMEVGLGPGNFVFDGDQLLQKKGHTHLTQFLAHIYCDCGQTAAWIRMPLGTQVGFGLRDIVLDRDTAPPPIKGHSSHQFSANVHCGQTAG